MMNLVYALAFCINLHFISAALSPVVTTKLGKVQGIVKTLDDGTPVNVYYGIRFGESTTGEIRFTKSIPAKPWDETYNATKYRDSCLQHPNAFTAEAGLSEDCLFLNVFQPAKHSGTKRTVMMWIYGGGFLSGSSNSMIYDARYIASMGDVIVVTTNYRLGFFGFYYGGTEEAPGNAGLYDQILALKWIHNNIESFGGDPNSVTIFGESAGGMSVGALVLSPLTEGLFKRAILQSGSPNSYLGGQSKERALNLYSDIPHDLGCNQTSKSDQIKCMKKLDAKHIMEYTSHATNIYGPTYNTEVMPIKPTIALRDGKFNQNVQLIVGTVHDEGSSFVTGIFKNLTLHPNITVSDAKKDITSMFLLMKPEAALAAAQYYTSGLTDNDKIKLAQAVASSFGDFHLTCPTVLFGGSFAQLNKNNKAYAYRLSQSPAIAASGGCKGWMGVCHGDDVVILFGFPIKLRGITFTENDYELSKNMIRAWTTFAKTGKPSSMDNIEWTEAIDHNESNPSVRIMDLKHGKYQMISNVYKSACDGFWKQFL